MKNIYIKIPFIIITILSNLEANAENLNVYCRCSDITPPKLWDADSWLWLNRRDKDLSIEEHLPWGFPINPSNADNEKLLIQRHYILNHDGDLKISTWAAYKLTKQDLSHDRTRTECFRKDIRVGKHKAGYCSDYKEPIYDQGHLVPNSDMERSLRAMINTYMMTNIAPQHCNFNRGTWLVLEKLVRKWVNERDEIYIITGAVFDYDDNEGRDLDGQVQRMKSDNDKERVAVPSHFYKILIDKNDNDELEVLSILLDHNNSKIPSDSSGKEEFFNDSIVSINEIESKTGNIFLSEFTDTSSQTLQQIKSIKLNEIWTFNGNWPGTLDANCN